MAALSFTVTNTGAGSYTADAPAGFTVALSGALSGATIDDERDAGSDRERRSASGWQGPLAGRRGRPGQRSSLILGPGDGNPQLLASLVGRTRQRRRLCRGRDHRRPAPPRSLMVSGEVAAQMISAATAGLAFTGQ